MKALRIKVEFSSGIRAGGINVRKDKNLRCNPAWQNHEQGVEIRLVLNGDTAKYEGKEGVEILDGEAAIDAAVESIFMEQYAIGDMALCMESVRQKKLDISKLDRDLSGEELAKALYDLGALGIKRRGKEHAPKAKAMAKAHGAKGD